jgi:hypothetical protein
MLNYSDSVIFLFFYDSWSFFYIVHLFCYIAQPFYNFVYRLENKVKGNKLGAHNFALQFYSGHIMANYTIEPNFSKITDTALLFVLTFFMTLRSYHVTFRMWLHGTISVHHSRADDNHKIPDELTTTSARDGFHERTVHKIPDYLPAAKLATGACGPRRLEWVSARDHDGDWVLWI